MRVTRIIACMTAVGFVLAVPSSIGSQTLPIRKVTKASQSQTQTVKSSLTKQQQQQLRTLSRSIAGHQVATWKCQDALSNPRTRASVAPWALPRSVGYRVWVQSKWKARVASCGRALSQRSIPATNDWLTAVKLVQRVYPGTSSWLLYISHREGGWGGFVMNHQGSGCGGWMQYASSTYWAYSGDAFADARSRGFIVDDTWNQWTNPMGQALTAAFMRFTGRDGHHWAATDW